MKLLEYLGISADELKALIDSGMINVDHHDKFPLALFSYSRQAQYDNTWPEPVRKCRGLIVREDTEEIIARPFEKFFNLETVELAARLKTMSGSGAAEESKLENIAREPDFIFEKMDGFMCTLYQWEGVNYIASKNRFKSTHAKWATATYRRMEVLYGPIYWPTGYTPIFEGLTKNMRIVVDYKDREELVLIGLVNIETGEEVTGESLACHASSRGFSAPGHTNLTLAESNKLSLNADIKNVEGYVAVWIRPGTTPFRLKIKFLDYLRLHRLITGVSPKRVLEALANGWSSEFDEWLDESTPWFSHFISKWKKVLEGRYNEILHGSKAAYGVIQGVLNTQWQATGNIPVRKDWALIIQRPEFVQYASVLYAMLDGKNVQPIIWKQVKPLIKDSQPMVDAHKT